MKPKTLNKKPATFEVPADWDFSSIVDMLNKEVGDIEPGPEREAKMQEVFKEYLAAAKTVGERTFWEAMIDTPGRVLVRDIAELAEQKK